MPVKEMMTMDTSETKTMREATPEPPCREAGAAARGRRGRTLYGDYEHTWLDYPQGTPTFRDASSRYPQRGKLARLSRCEVCGAERYEFVDGDRIYR